MARFMMISQGAMSVLAYFSVTALERLKERVRLLRPGQRDLTVHDEKRHALHPKPSSEFVGFLDRSHAVIAIQDCLGFAPAQTSFGNHVDERLPVADAPAIGEVRPE